MYFLQIYVTKYSHQRFEVKESFEAINMMYNVKSHVNGDFQNGQNKCTIEVDYNVKLFNS